MTLDSKTRHGPGELADAVGTVARATLGMFRRMAIKVTSAALWQVAGHRLLDGSRETRDAEVFNGIGVSARPKTSDKAEAVVFFVGGAGGSPLVIATRNEDARRALAAALNGGTGLKEGETAIYGSSGLPLVHIRDNNTVEIRLAGGSVQSTILGVTYRSAEDTMLTAIASAFTGLATYFTGIGQTTLATTCTAAATAITTFKTSASTYLSTVAKVQ